LIENCTTVRWWSSLQNKDLCRRVAAKRVEGGADKQSACSQVHKSPSLLMQHQGILLELMKGVANVSCCICSSNLL
jgi:hypothetical protein